MLTKIDLVVFDFDGTLSAKDCNVSFAKYCFAHSVRPWLFSPLILFGLMARYLNPSGAWWRQISRRFITADMVKRLSPGFIKLHKIERFGWSKDQVDAERAMGHTVILISAGPDYLIPHLVADIEFDAVMCSKMDQKKPWKFEFLCWGQNKVTAMDIWAKKNKLIPNLVRSYSDSTADLPLMKLAREEVWINPRTGGRIN